MTNTNLSELVVPEGLTQVPPIREIIFDYLRSAILEGRLNPNQKMIEREIAERFQASRIPVRDALQRLEAEGFLERRGTKSYFVRALDLKEVEEIYLIRYHLEPVVILDAAHKMDKEDFEKLDNFLLEAEISDKTGNYSEVSQGLHQFDSLLIEKSEFHKIKGILSQSREDLQRFRNINLAHPERRKNALQEHRKIYEALVSEDSKQTKNMVRQHILNSFEELKKEVL